MINKRNTGIYNKFIVTRTDGQSEPGQKHDGCRYFVLDATHDPHAPAALRAYANSCEVDYPLLAADVRSMAGQAAPDPGPSILSKLVAEFRREVVDKLSVVAHGQKHPHKTHREIVMKQCEDFLVEQFESALQQALGEAVSSSAPAPDAAASQLSNALQVECTCRVIEKCLRCEALDALPEDALRASAPPPISELVTCCLRDPDKVVHPRRLDCQHEAPHLIAACGAFRATAPASPEPTAEEEIRTALEDLNLHCTDHAPDPDCEGCRTQLAGMRFVGGVA